MEALLAERLHLIASSDNPVLCSELRTEATREGSEPEGCRVALVTVAETVRTLRQEEETEVRELGPESD